MTAEQGPGPAPVRRLGWRGVAVACVVLAVAAALSARVELNQDLQCLLPDGQPELRRARVVLDQALQRMVIDVGARDGARVTVEDLGAAADRLAEALVTAGVVEAARSSFDGAAAVAVTAHLRALTPLLLDDDGRREVAARLKPDRMHARLALLARRLQEPDGFVLAEQAARDPLGLTDLGLAPLGALMSGLRGARLKGGRLFSGDLCHVLVIAKPGFSATDLVRSERMLTVLAETAAELAREPRFAGVEVRHLGSHRSTLDNARQVRRDVLLTTTMGVVLIGGLAFLFFGALFPALLALLPAGCGALCAFAFFALRGRPIPALVAGFGAVLLGLTIDYAVHVLVACRDGADRVQLPVRALLAGAGTTAVAFLSLQLSAVPGIRDIGVFGAVGVSTASLFALTVLPRLAELGTWRGDPIVDLRAVVRRLRGTKVAIASVALLAVVTPFVVAGTCSLKYDGDVTRLSSLSPANRADESAILAVWGDAFRFTSVVVEAPTLAAAVARNQELLQALDRLQADGVVRAHASIAGLMPPISLQEQRLRAWRALFTPERVASLRRELAAAATGTPFRGDAFEPFLAFLETPPAVTDLMAVAPAALVEQIGDRITRDEGAVFITTPVFTAGPGGEERLQEGLAREAPGASVVDRQGIVRRLAALVGDEVGLLGGVALLVTAAFAFVLYGSFELAFITMVPLVLSCTFTFGLLGHAGLPLNLANAIFVPFLFGIAIDYTIFLTEARLVRFRGGPDRTGDADTAVLFCSLTTCCGFGSLVLATHPVMRLIGQTALLGIGSALLTTQILVPAMLRGVLARPPAGNSGPPGFLHLYGGLKVFWMLTSRALWFELVARWFHPRERWQDEAQRQLSAMGHAVRYRTPLGRRRYVDATATRFAEPGVIVANHGSVADLAVIFELPVRSVCLVKRWVWKTPLMGTFIRHAGYILAEGREPDAILADARAALAAGFSVVVFPEGTKSRHGRITRFHNGAFAIARAAGVHVTPVALVNGHYVCPPDSWWVGEHELRAIVLDRLDPADFKGDGADRRMACAARDAIRAACARAFPETQRGPGWERALAGRYRYLGAIVSNYAWYKLRYDPLVESVSGFADGDGAIFVAGCGYGLVTGRLAIALPDRAVEAVDYDERKITIARAALGDLPNLRLEMADLRDYEGHEHDLALLVDVLHYWTEDVQVLILERVVAALRPGGRLLFRDGCREGGAGHGWVVGLERLATRLGFTRAGSRLVFRTEAEWRRLLTRAGLTIESVHPELGLFSNVVVSCRKNGWVGEGSDGPPHAGVE